jgi:hypothetical protein
MVPCYTFRDAAPNPNAVPAAVEIVLRPSAHQALNARSLEYRHAVMRLSKILYRS